MANDHTHEPMALGMPEEKKQLPKRSMGAVIGGGIGAAIGYVGGMLGYNVKLADFERDVAITTKNNIVNSLAASASEGANNGAQQLGRLGAGIAEHTVREGVFAELSKDTEKYGKLPKRIYDTFRAEGGKGTAALVGAAAVGAVGAAAAYALSGDSEEPKAAALEPKAKDWAGKVEASEQAAAAETGVRKA